MERRGAQTNSQRYSAVALISYLGEWMCGKGVCIYVYSEIQKYMGRAGEAVVSLSL